MCNLISLGGHTRKNSCMSFKEVLSEGLISEESKAEYCLVLTPREAQRPALPNRVLQRKPNFPTTLAA